MKDYANQQRRILTPRMTRNENIAFIIVWAILLMIVLFIGGGD